MDQVKDIAASYEVCHPSCPNSCFGPQLEHCTIVAVEQYQLTDRDYQMSVSKKVSLDLDSVFNSQQFIATDYTITVWIKYTETGSSD